MEARGAKSRKFKLESVVEEDEYVRPSTTPEVSSSLSVLSNVGRHSAPPLDISSLFEVDQLTGRQVSWSAVRMAMAELSAPATLPHIGDMVWRMYQDYCQYWTLPINHKSSKFEHSLVKTIQKNYDCLHVQLVGSEENKKEFIWLDTASWPSNKEITAWRHYRTVHQAVRSAIQDIVNGGEMFTGLFTQIKAVHEFVETHTLFTKKQVRDVLAELQPQLRTFFKPGGPGGCSKRGASKLRKSQSLESVSMENKIPWNYGIGGGRNKMICTWKKRSSDNKENDVSYNHQRECSSKSSSLLDISDLSKLIDYRNHRQPANNYLD